MAPYHSGLEPEVYNDNEYGNEEWSSALNIFVLLIVFCVMLMFCFQLCKLIEEIAVYFSEKPRIKARDQPPEIGLFYRRPSVHSSGKSYCKDCMPYISPTFINIKSKKILSQRSKDSTKMSITKHGNSTYLENTILPDVEFNPSTVDLRPINSDLSTTSQHSSKIGGINSFGKSLSSFSNEFSLISTPSLLSRPLKTEFSFCYSEHNHFIANNVTPTNSPLTLNTNLSNGIGTLPNTRIDLYTATDKTNEGTPSNISNVTDVSGGTKSDISITSSSEKMQSIESSPKK